MWECIKPQEREALRSKMDVQVAVLEYLYGKRTNEASTSQLWAEVIHLRAKLKTSDERKQHCADNLCASWKIMKDLKLQLQQNHSKETAKAEGARRTIRELHWKLREVIVPVHKMKVQLLNQATAILSTEREGEMSASELEEKLQVLQTCMDLFDKLQEVQKRNTIGPCNINCEQDTIQNLLAQTAEANSHTESTNSELEQEHDVTDGTNQKRTCHHFPDFTPNSSPDIQHSTEVDEQEEKVQKADATDDCMQEDELTDSQKTSEAILEEDSITDAAFLEQEQIRGRPTERTNQRSNRFLNIFCCVCWKTHSDKSKDRLVELTDFKKIYD
uniref:uncharacterized protein LOC131107892 isoform X2 n=1 Tax=Doryrhamphus excisus TaxID=161450 RepID=UPI0025AE2B68|nr:uncharacterized protein LOC131107892 isoform X2 [Doryrhamphus excisus]